MNVPKAVFELMVGLSILIGGVTGAVNGVVGWGLAVTGTLLLTATLVAHARTLPLRAGAR
ncbi:hypothetical protein FCL40_12450 [Ferrimonas sediminicola]|uniref:Uncharacterized protein n=1 Tax=Ferrimonas sediminicola TaxID=2569538 RepID=A0A4U1BCS4_9GAMM|nr:hypothetical protein [Ferrimonas sediminicola]TKB48514.1 hypothetical protein FCL40_12450 [Ferrimonas sediminicola]